MFTRWYCSRLTSSFKSKSWTILNSSQYKNQPSMNLFIPCTNSMTVNENFTTTYRFYCTPSATSQETLGIVNPERKDFDSVFPELLKSMVNDYVTPNCNVDSAATRFKDVFEYIVPTGKRLRSIIVLKAFQHFSEHKYSEEDLHLAKILGGCVEMYQATFGLIDDIMDQSEIRRDRICWHKKEGIGLTASTDAFLLEQSMYLLLKKYFRNKPYYGHITDLFHELTYQTVMGQSLDMISEDEELKTFTEEKYNAIVKYKTAFYSFYFPVSLGMHMAGVSDKNLHSKTKPILLDLGHLFQVQDDYIDVFGDVAVTGKVGTDIVRGKCNWIIVKALELANPEQTAILQENYGKKDSVDKIHAVYEELKLKSVYEKFEDQRYKHITKSIEELGCGQSASIFKEYANLIYKRIR